MSEEIDALYDAYYSAEVPMREVLESSGLTANQIVALGQLAPAIVDGRTASEENARVVVAKVLDKCRELHIPEDLIGQFRKFGDEWADRLYPHE